MGTLSGLVAVVSPPGVGVLAMLVAVGVASACLPLRGGHGQHAGAGPGALTVEQLFGEFAVPDQEIVWPDEDPDELTSWLWFQPDRGTERLLEPLYLAESLPRAWSCGALSSRGPSSGGPASCAGARAPGVGGIDPGWADPGWADPDWADSGWAGPVRAGADGAPEYVGRHRLSSITDTHHLDIRFHATAAPAPERGSPLLPAA